MRSDETVGSVEGQYVDSESRMPSAGVVYSRLFGFRRQLRIRLRGALFPHPVQETSRSRLDALKIFANEKDFGD